MAGMYDMYRIAKDKAQSKADSNVGAAFAGSYVKGFSEAPERKANLESKKADVATKLIQLADLSRQSKVQSQMLVEYEKEKNAQVDTQVRTASLKLISPATQNNSAMGKMLKAEEERGQAAMFAGVETSKPQKTLGRTKEGQIEELRPEGVSDLDKSKTELNRAKAGKARKDALTRARRQSQAEKKVGIEQRRKVREGIEKNLKATGEIWSIPREEREAYIDDKTDRQILEGEKIDAGAVKVNRKNPAGLDF